MKFSLFGALISFSSALLTVNGYEFKRLDKNDTLLLVVDHQVGLFQIVKDYAPDQFKNNILAHAALGVVFDLPTIMTTSAETGPNGPLPKELLEMHPTAPLIKRNGEVDAWDNPSFRAAVEAAGKSQIILGGITTDVCTVFLALSLRAAGYDVWANADASGTFDSRTAADANNRMRDAGVQVVSMFSIATDLMRDWRNTPGTKEMLPFFDTYLSSYGFLTRAHAAAVLHGALGDGEAALV
ncbi:hypothetical protein RUND412_004635 [Rhizina undulata]